MTPIPTIIGSTQMTEELKPCPFCGDMDEFTPSLSPIQKYAEPGDPETGKVANLAAGLIDAGWLVECSNCSACGAASETQEGAITAWNTRLSHSAEKEALIEALERIVAENQIARAGLYRRSDGKPVGGTVDGRFAKIAHSTLLSMRNNGNG